MKGIIFLAVSAVAIATVDSYYLRYPTVPFFPPAAPMIPLGSFAPAFGPVAQMAPVNQVARVAPVSTVVATPRVRTFNVVPRDTNYRGGSMLNSRKNYNPISGDAERFDFAVSSDPTAFGYIP